MASAHWRADVLACSETNPAVSDYVSCLDLLGSCLDLLGIQANTTLSKAVPRLWRDFDSHAALNYDGDRFYAETLTSDRLRDEYPDADLTLVQDVAEQLREVYKRAGECNISSGSRPARYYAVLAMDGDHMGAFFAHASDHQARSMSEAISAFARTTAIEIVERHYGRAVYAGGDDLLALLPMADALPCADELATGFDSTVQTISIPDNTAQPSVSIGIALAHHTSPLQVAIEASRSAEHSAKRRYRRAAVCVHVMKRSGEEVRVGSPLSLPGEDNLEAMRPLQVVERYIEMLRQGKIAGKFPTALAEEARGLSGSTVSLAPEARMSRVRWIARRHAANGYEPNAEEVGSDLCRWADRLAARIPGLDIEEVALWTGVGRFIAKGGSDE